MTRALVLQRMFPLGYGGNPSINSGHRRVKATVSGVTTAFIGTPFEWTGSPNTNLTWLFGDHPSTSLRTSLGSTSVTTDLDGDVISRTLYKPWGGRKRHFRVRYQSGTLPTQYTYTGQYSHTADTSTSDPSPLSAGFGLMYYVARWYDPVLGRFAQADSIVPGAGNPLAWDRYAYVNNGPTNYTDPSGHDLVYCSGPSCGSTGQAVEINLDQTFTALYGVGIDREFNQAETTLIKRTIMSYANLLGGIDAWAKETSVEYIEKGLDKCSSSCYIPDRNTIELHEDLLTKGTVADGWFGWSVNYESVFPNAFSSSIEAFQFVLAHEIGHGLIHSDFGNNGVLLTTFKHNFFNCPGCPVSNLSVERNMGRSTYAEEVLADVIAARVVGINPFGNTYVSWINLNFPGAR